MESTKNKGRAIAHTDHCSITRLCLVRWTLVHPYTPGEKDCPHFADKENEVREERWLPILCVCQIPITLSKREKWVD